MSESYKSNHYVPKTYLKRWASNDSLIIYHKEQQRIISDITKNATQKKNLYTLPKEFETEDHKIIEKLLLNKFENNYAKSITDSFELNLLPTEKQSNALINFIIIQHTRTIKFKKLDSEKRIAIDEYQKKILKQTNSKGNLDNKDIPEWHNDYTIKLSNFILFVYPEIKRYSTVEFLKAAKGYHFITSDNPSSSWFKKGEDFFPLEYSILDPIENDLYLICPLNPEWCGILYLYSLKKKNNPQNVLFRNLNDEDTITINKMIYRASDKILILSEESDKKFCH